MKMVNVVCMKWKKEDGTDKFGPEYVNRLYKMVRRNLTIPHRFVCFTDDAKGLDKGIETMPLPPVKLRTGLPERGWKKLGLLSAELGDLSGIALFLDLDVVVVDNMDDLFKVKGKFIIARDTAKNEEFGNSSVFRFEIGQHADILKFFEENFDTIRRQVRHEQAYMSREMKNKRIFSFWDVAAAQVTGGNDFCACRRRSFCNGWCVSFKYCCLLPFPLNWFMTPKIPRGAKIIIFHGNPNNEQAMNGFTAKFGLRHVRPVEWVREYWVNA